MDPIRRVPRISRDISRSLVQTGTKVTVRWPQEACYLLAEGTGRFVQTAVAYATFNPHVAIRGPS
jgi:hypothetical protein